jgi:cytochrome c553
VKSGGGCAIWPPRVLSGRHPYAQKMICELTPANEKSEVPPAVSDDDAFVCARRPRPFPCSSVRMFAMASRDKIPPCLTCHGAKAEGAGKTPRLAGQHRLSLERQLAYYAADTRVDTVMHQESTNLTAQQMTAVSAYLAAQ